MAADNQMAISFAKLVSKRLISLQEKFFFRIIIKAGVKDFLHNNKYSETIN